MTKKTVKHRSSCSLLQRQGDGSRQGRDWSRDTRCRGTAGIQDRTQQSFSLAETIQFLPFPDAHFCVVLNFLLSSSDPQVTLKATIKNKELDTNTSSPQTHLLLFYFSMTAPYSALGTRTLGSHVWPAGKRGRIKLSQVQSTGSYTTLP